MVRTKANRNKLKAEGQGMGEFLVDRSWDDHLGSGRHQCGPLDAQWTSPRTIRAFCPLELKCASLCTSWWSSPWLCSA